MRKVKQSISLLLVFIMVLSLLACSSKDDDSNETTNNTGSVVDVPENITVNLHYLRDDNNYEGWNVWFWTSGDGASYTFGTDADENGVTTTYVAPTGTTSIGFIIRLNEWESKDVEEDLFIDTSSIIGGTIDVYVKSGQSNFKVEHRSDVVTGISVLKASVTSDLKQISFTLSEAIDKDDSSKLTLVDKDGKAIDFSDISVDGASGTFTLKEKSTGFETYYILIDGKYKFSVTMPDVYSTSDFEDKYTYVGGDLGANWSLEHTNFRVWAPTATAVKLNIYESGDVAKSDLVKSVDMTSDVEGTWIAKENGDLNGKYYTYSVTVNGNTSEACDPYAKAVGVNGNRAMVIDLASTNPAGWANDSNPNSDLTITDSIIYELQVRDFSSDASSGMTKTGKYLALTEKGTKNASGKSTGLDYMLDLGITHLQLNPVYDFATVDETKLDTPQYNWGYDPKNYNVPEGSFSSDPYNGEVRIKEFKQTIKTLHDNGISVVMDVVYNHTYNTDYCFNKIVPGYFYREGSNGSGCGNDVASERAMVSKFIVESVAYWAKEYHIDGFRFDLVGLMDVDTMNEIRAAVDKIDPSIILYGEGWNLTTTTVKADTKLAVQANAPKMPGIALFNDYIRDSAKGSVFDAEDFGYVNGATKYKEAIMNGVKGKTTWSSDPTQLINYTSCHDNLTLWDKINSSNGFDTLEDRIKQNLLAASIIYTSQGVPFMLAGEEMLRSKVNADGTFNHNSYNASDSVNSIKWSSLDDQDTSKVVSFYKGLISFRKAHKALRMTENPADYITFVSGTENGVIAYSIDGVEGEASNGIFVIYNPLATQTTVSLPDGNWDICVKGMTAGTQSLGKASGSITVDAISCVVLVKNK